MANPLVGFAGDPTHPAVVHFPLALYPAALLFDGLAWAGANGGAYTRAAFVLMVAATVGATAAMVTGFAQLAAIAPESRAWQLALVHMSVQLGAACILVTSLLLRLRHIDDAHPSVAATACAAVGTLALFVGGWAGGHLVFRHGVGVEPQMEPNAEPEAAERIERTVA